MRAGGERESGCRDAARETNRNVFETLFGIGE